MGHVLVLDDSEAQFALTRLSRDLWDARAAEWPATVERDTCGTIWVAADEEELQVAHQRCAWFAARGVRAEALNPAHLARLEPNLRARLAGGLLVPQDSVVYPPGATRYLLDRATAAGAVVEDGQPVARAGDGWIELLDGRRLEADVVLLAAGLATARLTDVPGLTLRPKKGHLAITDRVPGFIRHQLIELGYLRSAHGGETSSVAFNAQPRTTGQVLLGSSRQVGQADDRVEPGILARMVRRALDYLPGLGALPVVRAWVGLRPATKDNLPIIGPVPGRSRLWLATGHEGIGIATSLGTARLVLDGLLGQPSSIDPAPYGVERLSLDPAHG
jgi:glycine/D-amino acid oxidase-like deaminating enzyme